MENFYLASKGRNSKIYFIILKPLFAYLEVGVAAISSGRTEAEGIEAQIAEKMAAYEAELDKAKGEIATLRNEQRAEAQAAYDGVLAQARTEADGQVGEAVTSIEATRAAAAQTLQGTSAELAQQVASQVLGRELAAR